MLCVRHHGARKDGLNARETSDRPDPRHVVIVPDRPAHVAQRAHHHSEREDEPELGLVDALVALRHPDDPPVVERPGGDYSEDDPDEAPEVCQALVVTNVNVNVNVRNDSQSGTPRELREGGTHDLAGIEAVGHGEDCGRARRDETCRDVAGISEIRKRRAPLTSRRTQKHRRNRHAHECKP